VTSTSEDSLETTKLVERKNPPEIGLTGSANIQCFITGNVASGKYQFFTRFV